MDDRHVIIGAGPVGRAAAAALEQRGAEVVLASRSGANGTTAVDATSADALARLAEGAVALYNCVNPPAYDKWTELWPPVAEALPPGRRTQRRGAGHRGEPLPVRTGARRADARGNARLGSRQEGPGAGEDDRRRVRGSPGRAGPGGRGSRERLHGCRPGRVRPRAASHRQSASGEDGQRRGQHGPAAHLDRRARHGPRSRNRSRRRSRPGAGCGMHRPTPHARRPRQSTTCWPASVRSRSP